MLPENVFDPLLGSLSLIEPHDPQNYIVYEAISGSRATDGTKSFSEMAVRLWYEPDGNISFDRFIDRLKSELSHLDHKNGEAITGALAVLFTMHPRRPNRPTAVLNEILSLVVDADISQFFVLPHLTPPGFRDFKIGHFSVGELNTTRLGYRSKRAGSDYFVRYKDNLVGSFAIERDPARIRVLDLSRLVKEYKATLYDQVRPELWARCVETYFHALAAAYYDDFWDLLMEDQNLVIACGAPYMDERQLRMVPFTQPISIFLNIDNSGGFVAPALSGEFRVDLAAVDRHIPAILNRLSNEFGIEAGAGSAPALKNYALFVSKAKRYSDEGLQDEAFVHYVIALELLFSERSHTAESVSRRAATLVFRAWRISISEAERKLDRIYDARSSYVHAGKPVNPKLLTEAKEVCEEVLWAFLRYSHLRSMSEDMVALWTKDLDYLYSAFIAGKAISEHEIRSCGILSETITP